MNLFSSGCAILIIDNSWKISLVILNGLDAELVQMFNKKIIEIEGPYEVVVVIGLEILETAEENMEIIVMR